MIEEKIEMQENFIKDLDKGGKDRIEKKKEFIQNIDTEIEDLSINNETLLNKVQEQLQPKLEELSNTNSTLKKLNSIRAKLEWHGPA
jgi:predicted secreted Zn-dependent protease